MRQAIKWTEADVRLQDGTVVTCAFQWRRAGRGAVVRCGGRVQARMTDATYTPLADDGTSVRIDGAEGSWTVTRVNRAGCGCGSKPKT